jgi:hypothetical protein
VALSYLIEKYKEKATTAPTTACVSVVGAVVARAWNVVVWGLLIGQATETNKKFGVYHG